MCARDATPAIPASQRRTMSRELPQIMPFEGTCPRVNRRLRAAVGICPTCHGSRVCTPAFNHSLRNGEIPSLGQATRGSLCVHDRGLDSAVWRERGASAREHGCGRVASAVFGLRVPAPRGSGMGAAVISIGERTRSPRRFVGGSLGRVRRRDPHLHMQRRAVTRSTWPLLDETGVRMRSSLVVMGARLSKLRDCNMTGRAEPRPGS